MKSANDAKLERCVEEYGNKSLRRYATAITKLLTQQGKTGVSKEETQYCPILTFFDMKEKKAFKIKLYHITIDLRQFVWYLFHDLTYFEWLAGQLIFQKGRR